MVRLVRSGCWGALLCSPLWLGILLAPASVRAQGQALPPIKVNLPATPNFDIATAPPQYPTGEMSVYGLRKSMSKYLDKDVRVKAYLLVLYECPPELRKCNDELAAKAKKEAKKKAAAAAKGAPPEPQAPPPGGCRPCDQPHFFISDTPTTKIERALLVADYPVKDWETGKPKPLVVKPGEQLVVTGTFAINSITGFAASNGLIIHKKTEDMQAKVLAEGNAVLPPEAQTINLEGKPPEMLAPAKAAAEKK
jgi:hypothetical protein